MIYKFKHSKRGGHVHVKFFAGRNIHTLGLAGDFTLRVEEWPLFTDMLHAGAHVLRGRTAEPATVIFDDITADEFLERGRCGMKTAHDPHRHISTTLGVFMCHGEETTR